MVRQVFIQFDGHAQIKSKLILNLSSSKLPIAPKKIFKKSLK